MQGLSSTCLRLCRRLPKPWLSCDRPMVVYSSSFRISDAVSEPAARTAGRSVWCPVAIAPPAARSTVLRVLILGWGHSPLLIAEAQGKDAELAGTFRIAEQAVAQVGHRLVFV